MCIYLCTQHPCVQSSLCSLLLSFTHFAQGLWMCLDFRERSLPLTDSILVMLGRTQSPISEQRHSCALQIKIAGSVEPWSLPYRERIPTGGRNWKRSNPTTTFWKSLSIGIKPTRRVANPQGSCRLRASASVKLSISLSPTWESQSHPHKKGPNLGFEMFHCTILYIVHCRFAKGSSSEAPKT